MATKYPSVPIISLIYIVAVYVIIFIIYTKLFKTI